MFKITPQASRKSYLIIMISNSYEKLESVQILLKIIRLASMKSYLVIIDPVQMQS